MLDLLAYVAFFLMTVVGSVLSTRISHEVHANSLKLSDYSVQVGLGASSP